MTDDIFIRFSVKDDGSPVIEKVNQKLGKTKEVSMALVPGLEKAREGLTRFAGANATLIGLLAGVGVALGKVIKDHLAYADGLRSISNISKASIEDTSRLVAVLDDYKITTDDVVNSARAMKEKGLVPTIETLAKLSDQYLAIQDPAKRYQFAQDNLGRSASKYTEILEKGSKAILDQGAAVSKGLIWTEKMEQDARRAEVAIDNWNDSLQEVKTTLAVHLLPAMTDSADGMLWLTKTAILFFDAVKEGKLSQFDLKKALKDTREEIKASENAMNTHADAANGDAGALDELTASQEENEKTAKALSAVYEGLLSSIFAIEGQTISYHKTLDDLANKDNELAAEKDKLTLKMWEEQRAGKLTNDEYDEYIQKLADITKAQDENSKSREDANTENEKAGKQRVYDLVNSKLAADGLIDSGEYEYLQNLAVQKGLVSRASADQAIKENQLADQLVQNFSKTQPAMDQTLSVMQQIAGYNGTVVNFGVNFSQTGSMSVPGIGLAGGGHAGGGNISSGAIGGGIRSGHVRDSGGPGMAGTPYMIGTGAQPEVFVPNTNGQFYPKGKGLGPSTQIINIYNPKKETAENSIRQALKKLSYIGAAS